MISIKPVFVPDQQNEKPTESFEQVNDELTRGLQLCHSVVEDYRSKFRRRLNEDESPGEADDDGADGG